jgi:hypothetical protein
LLALVCAWGLSACAGDGPPPSSATSSFDSIQQTIFSVNCLFAGCHNATDRSGNMVLAPGQAYNNLVNVVPSNPAAAAAGFRRVVPENPAQSFLLIKLIGGPNFDPNYGSPMPLIGGHLSAADIESIREWILAGAPPPNLPAASAFLAPTPTPTSTITPPAAPPTTTPAAPV